MIETPQDYHRATGYDRYAMEPHAMDWAGQPDPYKRYPSDANSKADGIALPEVSDFFDGGLFDQDLTTVYEAGGLKTQQHPPGRTALSKICMLANGLTARSRQGDGYFYYRSAPSAGALYPNEMYFISFGSPEIPAGVYHCGVHNRFLTRIRNGNYAAVINNAVGQVPADSAGVFVLSGIFFRSAWKYRKRAYRYVMLDAGHLAENLRLAISAAGYACRLHHAFDDRQADALLGLDPSREGSLCCVSISGSHGKETVPEEAVSALPPSIPAACRVSPAEIVYPEITGIHEASKTIMEAEPDAATGPMIARLGISPEKWQPQDPAPETAAAGLNYSQGVFSRRSKRNFIPLPIEKDQLTYILSLLCRATGELIDEKPAISNSACIGFLAGNVRGVEPGFYLLDPSGQKTGRVFSGHVIEKMASVCLDQAWLKNAAVHFVFMSNLELLGKKWGARGYRYAMMTAGRLGHAVYLGATVLGLGCCGIGALYDNEAQQLLGLNAESALLYLAAVGITK